MLKNKVVIVTGAGDGIGRDFALAMLRMFDRRDPSFRD